MKGIAQWVLPIWRACTDHNDQYVEASFQTMVIGSKSNVISSCLV